MKIFYHCCPTKERGSPLATILLLSNTPFDTCSARYRSFHKCQRGLLRGQPSAEIRLKKSKPPHYVPTIITLIIKQ